MDQNDNTETVMWVTLATTLSVAKQHVTLDLPSLVNENKGPRGGRVLKKCNISSFMNHGANRGRYSEKGKYRGTRGKE